VLHIRAASARAIPFGRSRFSEFFDDAFCSLAVGVGQETAEGRLTEWREPSFCCELRILSVATSIAVGVGHDTKPVASVGRSDIGSSVHAPPDIVAHFGHFSEYVSKEPSIIN
jgi:hypothetical protein